MRPWSVVSIVAVGAFLGGCDKVASVTGKKAAAVYLLFDISGSTRSTELHDRNTKAAEEIADRIAKNGGVIFGDVIGSEALNSSTLPVHVLFPVYNPLKTTDKKFNEETGRARETLRQQVRAACAGKTPSARTALMASLEMAGKVFNGEQVKALPEKRLVIFSDMVEESENYDFTRERLTPARIQAIVEAERKAGRLPHLNGVRVWKAGAASVALDDNRNRDLECFWIAYFKAAGADLAPEHFGPTLLDFTVD